ncbi:ATP-binding protein [soil metagenome]
MNATTAPAFRPLFSRLRVTPRLSSIAVLFSAALLVLAWTSVAAVLLGKRHDDMTAEIKQNRNLAAALTEQTLRVIATVDQASLRVANEVAQLPAGDRPDLQRFANETGLVPGILVQLSVIGPDGRFVNSNLDPDGSKNRQVDLSTREHVQVHLQSGGLPANATLPGADGLYVGKPVLGKVSRKWTIQISRKISSALGEVLGVVVASVDPSYFEGVFAQVSLGEHGGVALIGSDLTVRARVIGGKAGAMGAMVAPGSPFQRHLGQIDGDYVGVSGVDGVERLTGFRRVADYPLYVTVSTSVEEALADWRVMRNMVVGLTALLTAVLLGAALGVSKMVRHLERSNKALRASESQALAANRAKGEFLAAMSHELRTPLTSIRGFAELMEHRLEQPQFREQAGLIRKGAEYLNTLLTEILDLSKVEAGAMTLAPQPLELAPLLEGTAAFFALAAEAKGITLTTSISSDTPGTIVSDGFRLKQVLNNLLSNAVKFTDCGSVTVSARTNGGWLELQVEDTGPGISLDSQERIFERFAQGDARVSYEHGGTGLGLALSRAIAELMQGTLTVVSSPGHGARFILALPLAGA